MIDTPETEDLTVLHIKHFPPDLHADVKIKAIRERIPMREWVIEALRDAVAEKVARKRVRAT